MSESSTPTANISPSRHPAHDSVAPSPPRLAPPPPPSPSPPHQRPPKRPRPDPMRASSDSDSSSQSGIADIETEHDPSFPSERSPPQAPSPPKKKRTRTLTTPHQSAVLHALLAKSRFPTTAMREEVGHQIGLSARKVQIWFQNQRQKARRPQSDSAPLSRPPQFGPFPIMTPAGPSSPSYPSSPAAGPSSQGSHLAHSRAHSAPDYVASLDSNPPLSGPAAPRWSSSSYQPTPPSVEQRDPPYRPPKSPKSPLGTLLRSRLPLGLSPRDARTSTRGVTLPPAQSPRIETSPRFSSVLPPITVGALEPRSGTESYVSANPFPPARPVLEQGSAARPNIPPPFVLQPQPQWDPLTFTPYTRPEFTSWLQSSGPGLSAARTPISSVGTHDPPSPDVSHRRRHFYPSPSEPRPLSHQVTPSSPSRNPQFSMPASSRTSASRDDHVRSGDEA